MEYLGGAGLFLARLGPGSSSAPRGMPTTNWGPGPAPIPTDEKAAASWVKEIGGQVGRDDEKPGQPIYLVDLTGTKVTDAGLKKLSGLTNLTILNLQGTEVTDAGLKSLAEHKNLSQLNLNATRVTDAGLKELAACMNLVVLELGSKVTDAGVANLRKALPKCKIFEPVKSTK